MTTLDQSLFVSDSVIEKPVTLPDGTTHTLYFKELPALEYRKFQLAEFSEDDEVKAASLALLISSSLCDQNGKPALTLQEAKRLKPKAMSAIFSAVLEINGTGNKAGESGSD